MCGLAFKRFVTDLVFALTSDVPAQSPSKPARPRTALAERLASSTDARDRLGVDLLAGLERDGRISLGAALAAAAGRGLPDTDAVASVERIARPQAAGLHRFYVDRSASEARLLAPDEVREKLVTFGDNKAARAAWASNIEVV